MLICFLLYNLSIKSLHKISSNRSVLNLLGHAHVLRIRRHVAPSDFPCPWWSSLAPPPPPLSLADRGQGPGPGPVVLKSGRNRRYRPVARPVIDSRAVTNQVSGPRPSGHFPAPTSGPRRAVPTSTVSPRPPGGRRVAEWPSRLREALSLSLSLASPSTQILRRPPLYVEETQLSREASPSRGPQPTAFHAAMSVHSWTSSTRLVATGPYGGTSRSSPPPPLPLSRRDETRSWRRGMRRQRSRVDGDEKEKKRLR